MDSFKVRTKTLNFILIVVSMAFMLYLLKMMLRIGQGLGGAAVMYEVVTVLIIITFIALMLPGLGKSIVVDGNDIIIRRYFLFSEDIALYEVDHCDLVTGLTTRGRIHRSYNELRIYYNGYKISFTDIGYANWDRLVEYMNRNGKINHVDGRSKFQKYIDDRFNNMMK